MEGFFKKKTTSAYRSRARSSSKCVWGAMGLVWQRSGASRSEQLVLSCEKTANHKLLYEFPDPSPVNVNIPGYVHRVLEFVGTSSVSWTVAERIAEDHRSEVTCLAERFL